MEKTYKWILLLSLILAVAVAASRAFTNHTQSFDNVAAVASSGEGNTVVATYHGSRIRFYQVDRRGIIRSSFSINRTASDETVLIQDLVVGGDGVLYYLKHYSDRATGELTQRQELCMYRWGGRPWGRTKTIRLDGSTGMRYGWLDLTTSLVLTGVDADGVTLERTAYDVDSLFTKTPVIKAVRSCPVLADQGVYSTAVVGSGSVVVSRSGKVYLTGEELSVPIQLYPDQQGEYATSYALFVQPESSESVIMGERKSGNLYRLYTADGRLEYIGEGSQGLGSLAYTFGDMLDLSFATGNRDSFTATVQNPETDAMELVVSLGGSFSLITAMRRSLWSGLGEYALWMLLCFFGILVIASLVLSAVKAVIGSRTVLLKLAFVSVPLMVTALTLFGVFTYRSYRASLSDTYATKIEDQGNLLRALFESGNFDTISSPDRFGSAEYRYIKATMDTRDVYTTSAYFVDRRLYTGVDETLPCLYPFAVAGNREAHGLYRGAALSGQQQTGIINDRLGERIACVTPVGSSSGDTIFLLETGVFMARIDEESAPYIRNYLIIAAICILATATLLLLAYTRILEPLRQIKGGLEQFAKGDSAVRIPSHTNDELADIARVFNKMAGDIDVQIYNLRNLTETYYRFIPQRIFHLLGKQNLSEVGLGSSVHGNYSVLAVSLSTGSRQEDASRKEAVVNRFFSTINETCNAHNATLMTDSIDLHKLLLICTDPSEAVAIAFAAIAQIDSDNARSSLQERIEVTFFLHTTEIVFSILGDEDRYVPALLSEEINRVLQKSDRFRELSSRFIVTEETHRLLDAGRYAHRLVGYADEREEQTGLYDFFDSCPPSMLRLFRETLDTFNKAVALYYQRRYYDAKNLFTIVLRENQYDNVARYYIFQCEKQLDQDAARARI